MTPEPDRSFTDKLNRLFRTIKPSSGREYTPEYVADWLRSNGGPSVSASYVYLLRRGQRTNPTKMHIEGLARFFEITPAYFFDEDLGARISEELDLLAALRDSDVRYVAMRTSELTDDARRSIASILREMDWARREQPPQGDRPDDEESEGPAPPNPRGG